FMINPVGVITKKNIIPITIGETTLPKRSPNLNHILFSGLRYLEFNNPKIKKNIEIIRDHIIILSPLNKGYIEIIKKTKK
mgnify:CR=1